MPTYLKMFYTYRMFMLLKQPQQLSIFALHNSTLNPIKTKQEMKQLRILALAITVIFFAASCSKDKTDKPVDNTSILGRWNVSLIVTVEQNNETYTYTGKEGDFIEFKADGTATSSVDGGEASQNYKLVDAKHIE